MRGGFPSDAAGRPPPPAVRPLTKSHGVASTRIATRRAERRESHHIFRHEINDNSLAMVTPSCVPNPAVLYRTSPF